MQLGISYISAYLKKQGHSTKLLVLGRNLLENNKSVVDTKMINKYIVGYNPKMICFTAVATEYQYITEVAKYIKRRYPDIYLMIGGPHASLNPEEVLSDCYDAVCIGEGEYPTNELASQLERGKRPSGIANLWIKHGASIEKNKTRSFLPELDSMPFPDREIWIEWVEEEQVERLYVLLGRGCPFQCAYCCNHALGKLSPGTYVRLRSTDNILEEIKELTIRFPELKEIYLEIETMGINKKWAIELCSKLMKLNRDLDNPLTFGTNLRITPNANMEDLFAAFKKSNFRFVNIGLESGSERIRREVLRRNYSNQDIIQAVKLAKKYGLKVCLYNMLGFPGETPADFMETVQINRICLPDWHLTSIFFPYPGTDLFQLCKEKGFIKGDLDATAERMRAVLDLPTYPKNQIQRNYLWFDYYVYRGRKPLYKILPRIIVSRIKADFYVLGYLYRIIMRWPLLKWLKKYLKEY
ncbi:MAG: radical SAM protein [Candidatus Margulisiibacteriota bacterium]